jgi:tetratricopeptide (TPR) repeat protein
MVGLPLVVLFGLECVLRLAGFGRPSTFLIPDETPGYVRSNPDFARLFLPGSFDLRPLNFRISSHKGPHTVRIVVLGESAAQGVPVPSFAFAPLLRAQLRAHYPGREFEVIDTGIVAVNSHALYLIARELAAFQPDLFVVYGGNNEVVGPYGPGCAYLSQMPPLWLIRASVFVRTTRVGQFLAAVAARLAPRGARPPEWGGMAMFVDNAVTGDDPRLDAVYRNFESNLRGIGSVAAAAGAKTLFCTVVANLKDCPPFLSRHRPDLAPSVLPAWTKAFGDGRVAWLLGEDGEAQNRLSEALRIDPQYADTAYMLGSLALRAGQVAEARGRFIDALHWDALRFRPDPKINEVVRRVAAETSGASLVDAAKALGADPASSAPPSGREILFEHVHFDWGGNVRLARMLAEAGAAALFGGSEAGGAWLDSQGCADALAYTDHERLPMLLRIDVLTRKPPFSNQLTYVADEARMAREIAAAGELGRRPETLQRAARVARDALIRDPDNPALAGILEGVDLDLGDASGALVQAERAERLLPRDYSLSADEASLLQRLGRGDEAERLLAEAARSGADLDVLVPALLASWTSTRRFAEGERFLASESARHPKDRRLDLARAALLEAGGDTSAAESAFASALAKDPRSEEALEGLVAVLSKEGRDAEVGRVSLEAADRQAGNQANDLRAAKLCEAQGDDGRAVRYFEAAERSGPATATFELTLALKLFKLGRTADMMLHLAQAKALSLGEGDPAVTDSIDKLVARMRKPAP